MHWKRVMMESNGVLREMDKERNEIILVTELDDHIEPPVVTLPKSNGEGDALDKSAIEHDDLVQKAIAFAVEHHAGMIRKEPINGFYMPFISHPIQVMKMVWQWGAGTPIALTAAVCHDIVEDTAVTHSMVKRKLGKDVSNIVRELTHDPNTMSKNDYLQSFAGASRTALTIKLADRFCNVADWYLTDQKYALKYFRKATPLFKIMMARMDEIKRDSAPGVAGNLAIEYCRVSMLVGEHG